MVSRTHQGLVRLRNEDWLYINEDAGFAVLADGMGGLHAGQIASRTAVDTARNLLEQQVPEDCDTLRQVLERSHQAVQTKARELDLLGQMGTTLVLWAASSASVLCGHVGDSRLYRYADGKLERLSTDQTLAQRLLDMGLVEPDEDVQERNAHILTQAVGLPGDFEPELFSTSGAGRFVLCSDGLTDMVDDRAIAEILTGRDLQSCCDELVKAALDGGGRDNVSVVLIEI